MEKQKQETVHFDIGVMGFWFGENYGSVLTYYALNRVLQDMNQSVLMIEKPTKYLKDTELDSNRHSRKFAQKYYKISKYRDFSQLTELNNLCNTFILGSDQVFNPGCYKGFKNNTLFFSFANTNKKLIAYASSFGHANIKFSFIEKIRLHHYLSKFSGLSVREESGLQNLHNLKLEGTQVLDPIFLCDTKHFETLILDNIPANTDQDYVLSYILDPTNEKRELIQNVSEKLHKPYKNILDGIQSKYQKNKDLLNLENTIEPTNLQNVLSQYKNCNFVITDSFHGICLAIVFKKPFIVIANKDRGIARFESLLNLLSLKNRLVYNARDAINNSSLLENINYTEVYKILNVEKEKSLNWLKNEINKPYKNRKQKFKDIFVEYLLNLYDRYEKIFIKFIYYRYKINSILLLSKKKRAYYKEKALKYEK